MTWCLNRIEIGRLGRNVVTLVSHLVVIFWLVLVSQPIQAPSPITSLAFDPIDSRIIFGSQDGIQACQEDGTSLKTLGTELESVNDIQFSPDGKTIAIVGGSPGEAGEIEIHRRSDWSLLWRKTISNDVLYSVSWSIDGKQLAIAAHDTNAYLIDFATRKVCQTWQDHSRPILAIHFLKPGGPIVSSSFDQTIRVWDRDKTQAIRSLNNHTREINAMEMSPVLMEDQNRMVVSVGVDRTVRFWQPEIGRLVRFAKLDSIPTCIAWDAKGKYVFVGCDNGKAVVVDVLSVAVVGEKRLFDGPVYCVASNSDHSRFAFGGSGGQWKIVDDESLLPNRDK